MNRRDFMKSVVEMPFIGCLVKKVVGTKTEQAKPVDLLNGTVWTAPWPLCHTAIVLYGAVKEGEWFYNLISAPYKRNVSLGKTEGTASMICHYDAPYHGLYTEEQLRKKLSRWKRRPELELRLWNRETEQLEWI